MDIRKTGRDVGGDDETNEADGNESKRRTNDIIVRGEGSSTTIVTMTTDAQFSGAQQHREMMKQRGRQSTEVGSRGGTTRATVAAANMNLSDSSSSGDSSDDEEGSD
ncbi:hypothetical protein ACHAXA_003288 [Cyclostephanos tholiformis]